MSGSPREVWKASKLPKPSVWSTRAYPTKRSEASWQTEPPRRLSESSLGAGTVKSGSPPATNYPLLKPRERRKAHFTASLFSAVLQGRSALRLLCLSPVFRFSSGSRNAGAQLSMCEPGLSATVHAAGPDCWAKLHQMLTLLIAILRQAAAEARVTLQPLMRMRGRGYWGGCAFVEPHRSAAEHVPTM